MEVLQSQDGEDARTIARFFWSQSGQDLEPAVKIRVLELWRYVVELGVIRPALYSALSQLAVYIDELTSDNEKLLRAVAPFVGEEYNFVGFVENLRRLSVGNPEAASRVLGEALSTYRPTDDFGDHLKHLMSFLYNNESTRTDAIKYMGNSKLLDIQKLYFELVGAN
jgi:hypothetical protein